MRHRAGKIFIYVYLSFVGLALFIMEGVKKLFHLLTGGMFK